jgi:hypothetical protein
MAFKEVVPGILVNEKFKVSIPHPDPCWIIRSPEDNLCFVSGDHLLVFSNEEKANALMKEWSGAQYKLKQYSWDDLVDVFKVRFRQVLVDCEKESGFYSLVPLQKGI